VVFAADVDVNDACSEQSCQAVFRNHAQRSKIWHLSGLCTRSQNSKQDTSGKKTKSQTRSNYCPRCDGDSVFHMVLVAKYSVQCLCFAVASENGAAKFDPKFGFEESLKRILPKKKRKWGELWGRRRGLISCILYQLHR
jgi:hypothetical protein